MVTRSQRGTLKPPQRLNLNVTSHSPPPRSYLQALRDPNWQKSMLEEYNAFIKNKTWNLVPRPKDVNIITCMWLFKQKFLTDGTLHPNKA